MKNFRAVLLAAAFGFGGASVASAADPMATPAAAVSPQGCDFFEAELIAYLCARTAYVGVSSQSYDLTNKFSAPIPGGVFTQKFETRQTVESGAVSITPWEGFRITVGDEAFQYKNNLTQQNVLGGGPPQPAFSSTASGSQAGWLNASVEYTLWDRRNDYGRFITNIVGHVEHFEGGGPYSARDLQMIGWNSGAKFALGGSGLSLNYFSNTLFQHFDSPDETRLSSYSRLLLANDAWGVGAGPRLNTVTELWHPVGVSRGWSDTQLGGEALLQPFRTTQIAFLKDMTLDGYYVHSIGQAGLIPKWNGSTSSHEFGGAARFNFGF